MDGVQTLDHSDSAITTAAERAITATLQASCQSPVASYATISGAAIDITALVALPDGSEFLKDSISGSGADAARLGRELAERLLASGARDLLERSEAMNV